MGHPIAYIVKSQRGQKQHQRVGLGEEKAKWEQAVGSLGPKIAASIPNDSGLTYAYKNVTAFQKFIMPLVSLHLGP